MVKPPKRAEAAHTVALSYAARKIVLLTMMPAMKDGVYFRIMIDYMFGRLVNGDESQSERAYSVAR
jgi:hypothetical protein